MSRSRRRRCRRSTRGWNRSPARTRSWRSSTAPASRLERTCLPDRRRPDRCLAFLLVDREAHALAVVLQNQIRPVLLQLGGEFIEREPVGRLPELCLELAEPVERLAPVLLVGIALFRNWKGEVLHGDGR